MPFGIGLPELLIVLVIIIIIFGVGRLPEIGGALGKGLREFKKSSSEVDKVVKDLEKPLKSETQKPRPRIPE
ncbi:MAG: twin-arginine translocase TatA/TatE family subunit [Chloroflexi bacterium]|nr:twin-arginine translocase TatA/TatE family subunit [Chloroflexota bacterium]